MCWRMEAGRFCSSTTAWSRLAEQARSILQKKKAQIVARVALIWCAIREPFEEKLDAAVVEGEEILTHCVPEIAALV